MFNLKFNANEFASWFSEKNLENKRGIVCSFKTPYSNYEFFWNKQTGEFSLHNEDSVIGWYKTNTTGYAISNMLLAELFTFFMNQYELVVTKDYDRYNSYNISRLNPIENEDTCEFISYNGNKYKIQLETIFNNVLCNIYDSLGNKIACRNRLNDTLLFRWIQGEVEFYEEMSEMNL